MKSFGSRDMLTANSINGEQLNIQGLWWILSPSLEDFISSEKIASIAFLESLFWICSLSYKLSLAKELEAKEKDQWSLYTWKAI